MRVIASNLGWLLISEIAAKGGLFAMAVLCARLGGEEALGAYTFAFQIAALASIALLGGQAEVLMREVARSPQATASLYAGARSFQLRLLPILLFALPLFWWLEDRSVAWVLLAFLPWVPLRVLLLTRGALFKGSDRMAVETVARSAQILVMVLGALVVFGLGLPLPWLGAGFVLGAALGSALAGRHLPATGSEPSPVDHRREGWPFAAITVALNASSRLDLLSLGLIGLGAAELGIYGAAQTPTLALLAAPQLVAVAIYPTLSRSEKRAAPRQASLGLGIGLGLGIALAAGLAMLGPWLIPLLFGEGLAQAVPLMQLLAWILPGASVTMLGGVLLSSWDLQRRVFGLQLFGLALTAAALLVTVPGGGLHGAALGVVIGQNGLGLATLAIVLIAAWRRGKR